MDAVELLAVPHVIVGVVSMARKDHEDRVGTVIELGRPDQRRYVEPTVVPIELDDAARTAVVDGDPTPTLHAGDELVHLSMRVPATTRPRRDASNGEDADGIEGDV